MDIDETIIPFSDDLIPEHSKICKCTICTNKTAQLDELQHIDQTLAGNIDDDAIFQIQSKYYNEKVKKPLEQHGIKVPDITAKDCKKHFTRHTINPKRMIANDIKVIDSVQKFLVQNGLIKKNMITNQVNVNIPVLKQWSGLSRNKLDLLRYYKTEYPNENKNKRQQGKSFNQI